LLAFVVLAAGCGSRVTQANYDKIKVGMTEKEVVAILGPGKEAHSSGFDLGKKTVELPGGMKFDMSGLSFSGKIMKWEDDKRAIFVTFVNGEVKLKTQNGL
jgi:hypothetical protein